MEDIDGGLHPAVDGQSLDEDEDEDDLTWKKSWHKLELNPGLPLSKRTLGPLGH